MAGQAAFLWVLLASTHATDNLRVIEATDAGDGVAPSTSEDVTVSKASGSTFSLGAGLSTGQVLLDHHGLLDLELRFGRWGLSAAAGAMPRLSGNKSGNAQGSTTVGETAEYDYGVSWGATIIPSYELVSREQARVRLGVALELFKKGKVRETVLTGGGNPREDGFTSYRYATRWAAGPVLTAEYFLIDELAINLTAGLGWVSTFRETVRSSSSGGQSHPEEFDYNNPIRDPLDGISNFASIGDTIRFGYALSVIYHL